MWPLEAQTFKASSRGAVQHPSLLLYCVRYVIAAAGWIYVQLQLCFCLVQLRSMSKHKCYFFLSGKVTIILLHSLANHVICTCRKALWVCIFILAKMP